jgi:hypothetical protein
MDTVACVLWVGNFKSRNYTPDWVYRLKEGVGQHLSRPHRFVCLSNVEVPGVEVIPLVHNWRGWWSKIELFGSHHLGSRVLFLDLDVLVTGSLDELLDHPAPMVLCPGNKDIYQTSCFVWSPPEGHEIYDEYTPEVREKFRGDQDWIANVKPDCAVFDKSWFSKGRRLSRETKVVFCYKIPPTNGRF